MFKHGGVQATKNNRKESSELSWRGRSNPLWSGKDPFGAGKAVLDMDMEPFDIADDGDARAKTASLAGRNEDDVDSLDEFAMNNSELFQSTVKSKSSLSSRSTPLSMVASNSSSRSSTALQSLPSAKTLRGGRSVVAKGRHFSSDTIASTGTSSLQSVSTESLHKDVSKFGHSLGSSMSPSTSPKRTVGQRLTPGLKADSEHRGRKMRSESIDAASNRSSSLSPQLRHIK